MKTFVIFAILAILPFAILAEDDQKTNVNVQDYIGKNIPFNYTDTNMHGGRQKLGRNPKLFNILQIVRFKNDVCDGGSKNGTCYTAEECESRGGTNSGDCADGFGICCTFNLDCGSRSSENCTYITQGATSTTDPDPCVYEICKCNSNVCRIRFDFNTFDIAGPYAGTAVAGAAGNIGGEAMGDCLTDTFSITSPGNGGTPIICGFNSGQHMIVDASDACHKATFDLGASSSTTRSWDIKVTQYTCGQESLSGPDGCLQYFTGSSGSVSSYNFPSSSTIGPNTQHLSSQCYSMCFRQESGKCAICFIPAIAAGSTIAATQDSFGLSVSATFDAAQGDSDRNCRTDFLEIPGGENAPITLGQVGTAASIASRFCGRFFNAISGATASISVCTQIRPFKITFKSTDGESATGTTAISATGNEQNLAPSGLIGFKLNYVQMNC